MYTALSTGAIRIRASLAESIDLAREHGFGGVAFSIEEAADLADRHGIEAVRDLFGRQSVRPAVWSLSNFWREDDGRFKDGLAALPRLAQVARELACFRVTTWMPSWSDERLFAENFEWHTARFRAVAEILKVHGQSLGIEYLGPKTLIEGKRYPFIHTQEGLFDLIHAIGTGNVGILLDSWHWYTSHGTLADLERLSTSDVVLVHVNDAPSGIAIDDQIDNVRCLPMETEVIDLPGFLRALTRIGYDGPVVVEPFSQRLANLTPHEACALTAESLRTAWQAAKLAS